MTTKNIKTILFAGLIVAMILPFSGMQMADAKSYDKETKQDLKNDVKTWLKDTKKDKKSYDEKSTQIKAKYDKLLRESIEEIRIETNTTELTEDEIQGAIDYIFRETVKDEKLKIAKENKSVKPLNIDFLEAFGIQMAEAACPSTTHPNYKQVQIDINGGSYGGYSFNGDNDLFGVVYSDNSSTCVRTYTLYFFDEDHPYLDAFYDALRISWYQRIIDIESFDIKNNNQIIFDDTYSSSNDFDCLAGSIVGCHLTATKTYSPGATIYVSNTWNHMMNTSDTNPSLSTVSVP
ncbi:MAG: hypothetical protein MAG458_00908 [Nitrosopumilus sp.]|nr:hypothetical protein [Nitrosopumilus sp.]